MDVNGGGMHEQKKTQNALVLGWGIGIVLVAVVIAAKFVFKF